MPFFEQHFCQSFVYLALGPDSVTTVTPQSTIDIIFGIDFTLKIFHRVHVSHINVTFFIFSIDFV